MKTLRIEVDPPESLRDIEGALADIRQWADKLIAAVPAEHLGSARLVLQDGECGSWIEIWYERPETDEDRRKAEAQARSYQAQKDAREREQYELLKRKFG
jgi:hypothetical protein